jgi:lipoprotein-anchoring transpeptidase ErfK/SrfK
MMSRWVSFAFSAVVLHGTIAAIASSRGCIRLTNWDALDLADMVRPGTPATLKE